MVGEKRTLRSESLESLSLRSQESGFIPEKRVSGKLWRSWQIV